MTDSDDLDPPSTKETSSADELAIIAEQRHALEDVVKISLAVTRLQHGLEAVLELGKPTNQIPKSYLVKFDAIKNSISAQPTDKLETSLTFLNDYIQKDIQEIMTIVEHVEKVLDEHDTGSINQQSIHDDIHKRLDDFKRKSQTAIVIRILLRERGVITHAIEVSVSDEDLASKISDLAVKEKDCRKRIHTEIKLMNRYVDNVLSNQDISHAVEQEMLIIKESLTINLDHLMAGKQLEDLPIVFEIVEMGTEDDHRVAFTPTSLPREAPVDVAQEKEAIQESQDVKRGFFAKLWLWMSTPSNVSWKDIDKK